MLGMDSEMRWSRLVLAQYRAAISAVDTDGPDSDSVPVLPLHVVSDRGFNLNGNPSTRAAPAVTNAAHGRVALLADFTPVDDAQEVTIEDTVLEDADDAEHANLDIWLWGGNPASVSTGSWFLFKRVSVTGKSVINLVDVPMAPAKVTVSFLSPGATVAINCLRSV